MFLPTNFVPSDITKLEEGMRVEHQKFGFGNVIEAGRLHHITRWLP
jgi:hypothetical protein